ncbi:MAG: response regulator, partial [Sandaracinaceae bacterium]|nr:response regulator [Sandaracinaceae bacterium]
GMGGLEVNRRVREILPRALVPHVAAMTASAFAEERRAFAAAGMDYVAKPISRSELAAVLERARAASIRLDESTLRGLASLVDGGSASVDGFLDELFESVRVALAQMERADSPEATRRAAHSLVGSAGVCGAFGISRAAMAIERVAPKGDPAETRLRVDRLRRALEGTMTEARQRRP